MIFVPQVRLVSRPVTGVIETVARLGHDNVATEWPTSLKAPVHSISMISIWYVPGEG